MSEVCPSPPIVDYLPDFTHSSALKPTCLVVLFAEDISARPKTIFASIYMWCFFNSMLLLDLPSRGG